MLLSLAKKGWTDASRVAARAAADNAEMATPIGFKGNKQALPRKACVACGREMVWRKAWARNWAEVKYCSDACRSNGKQGGKPNGAAV